MINVVSNNTKIPLDLVNEQINMMSYEEFLRQVNDDDEDGLEPEDGLWLDVDGLSEEIFNAVLDWEDMCEIRFYSWGIANITFDFQGRNITQYAVEERKPIEQPVASVQPVQPIQPITPVMPEPEPEPEPELEPEPTPVIEQLPPEPAPVPVQQVVQPQPVIQPQHVVQPAPVQQTVVEPVVEQNNYNNTIGGVQIVAPTVDFNNTGNTKLDPRIVGMIENDGDAMAKASNEPGKVILFGSSKGGTGKTFTCMACLYRFAKQNPNLRIAMADFDIIDGQVGILINEVKPTLRSFYMDYVNGNKSFADLHKSKVTNSNFPNVDIYLPPIQESKEITENTNFWETVFELLITNYDVIFFDSGIDYLGKAPISRLYKIANKIIITCNPSINSVKSVIKQLQILSGARKNDVFESSDDIINRTNVVLTRVYGEEQSDINELVANMIAKYSDIIAAFGQIDHIISKIQWYQQWELIDDDPDGIASTFDTITDLTNC